MSPDRRPNNQILNQERQKATREFLDENEINPKTFAFLKDCVIHHAYEGLEARKRNLIGVYYSTSLYLPDLKTLAGVTTYQGVRHAMLSGMNQMRQNLPARLQDRYQPNETFLFKRKISPESRSIISAALTEAWHNPEKRARMSKPKKVYKHSPETRVRISEVQIGKKHSIQARINMSTAQQLRRAREKAENSSIDS